MKSAWLAVGCGLPLGLLGAYEASRIIRTFVFRVSPTEPSLYALAAVLLALIVLSAAWLAARRAARVDPIQALRG